MPALTASQIAALSDSPPTPVAPVEPYEPWFKYDPQAQDAGAVNALRMIGNVPPSAFNVAKDLYEAGKSPLEIGEVLLRTVAGSGEEVHRRYLGGNETQNAELFRQMGNALIEQWKNPGQHLVEDPMGAALDMSAFVGAAPTAAGAVARRLSPLAAGTRGTAAGLEGGVNLARKGLEQLGGFSTGFEPRAFEALYQGTRKAPETYGTLRRVLSEQRLGRDISDDILQTMEDMKTAASVRYRARLPHIAWKNPLDRIDLGAFKTAMRDDLAKKYGIRTRFVDGKYEFDFSASSVRRKPQQNRFKAVLNDVINHTDDTPAGMDLLKQTIDDWYEAGQGFPKSNAFVAEHRKALRRELGAKVQGYDELVKDFETVAKQLKEIKTTLSTEAANPETMIGKLASTLRENPSNEVRRAVIDQLEAAGGKDLKAQIAALELSQWAPKSLIGRSMAAGAGYKTVTGQPYMLGLLAFTSPRVMGELFAALGIGKAKVRRVVKFMEDLHARVPPGMVTEGASVLTVVERLQQQGLLGEQKKREVRLPLSSTGMPTPND